MERGTTSAYAENTLLGRHRRRHRRNYLRVRGEYMSGFISPPPGQELPPRTRRIPRRCRRRPDRPGTTSAYAENTAASGLNPGRARNYLRVRGEYVDLVLSGLKDWELPPRTRRIQSHQNDYRMNGGTTSAYAENTADVLHRESGLGNYLRVRGEYAVALTTL